MPITGHFRQDEEMKELQSSIGAQSVNTHGGTMAAEFQTDRFIASLIQRLLTKQIGVLPWLKRRAFPAANQRN